MTAMIWMWSFDFFPRNFTRSTVLKFWVKTLVNKNNFSSLIITNELRFEPYLLNLISKWCAKDPKKSEDHLIFIHFGVKKFIVRNTLKKRKTLKFECYNLLNLMEWRVIIFLRLISNKATSRYYGYFLKFSYFSFLRSWFFQLCQKLLS
jgi:hypothetical protein